MAEIREILVVPHTHHDIGYTHTPMVCLEAHEVAVAEAMRLGEAALDDPSPTSFRWTFEIARPVLEYLRHAATDEVDRLRALVTADRLAVTAGYLHMTQLVGQEDAIQALGPVHELRERYGLYPSIVQHGDINGLPWGTVPLMAAAGLDTLVMALNPDHGRPPFEQPSAFYWEGPDRSRVLVWLSVHYGYARLAEDGAVDEALKVVPPLLARLEERVDYPFDFLILHAARDNMWPDVRSVNAARLWNEHGHTPPMRVVTIETAMARVREQASRIELPVARGEWADWWAHGHGSSAYEVGVGRQVQADLRAAATTHALLRLTEKSSAKTTTGAALGAAPPVVGWYGPPVAGSRPRRWGDRMREAYDELLLWEEHTWGAGESVTKPFSQVSQSHWNETAGFAYRAHTRARELRRDALQGLAETLPADDEPALVVVNPLSRQRDDMVTVTTREGVTARFVRDIPPLGVKVVPLDDGATAAAQEQPERATIIESGRYRIEVDPKSASIVSLVDKELGKEWVDSTALSGIAGVVYEAADPTDDHPAVTTHRKHFHPDTPGPRFVRTPVSAMGEVPRLHRTSESVTLSFDGTAPYLPCIRTSVTLYHRLDWIDVSVHLRKEENFDMEGVHVVFPFALERPRFLLESTGAVFEAGVEQLPDTSSDWYSIQHALGVTDGEASVLWATREAPLVQLGGFHTGEWARAFQPASGHVHAWLMNNLYFTNFKAAQGGELDVSFRFTTVAGDLDASDVRLWGEAFAAPGTAMIAPVRPGNYRWIDVSPDTVIAQVVTPTSDADDVVLRLRETAGQPVTAEITWLADGQVEVGMLDLFNVPRDRPVDGDGKTFRLRLQPHELASVALRRR